MVSIEHKISVRFLWGHSDANLPTSFSMTEVLKLCYSWAIKERAKTDWAKSFGPLLTSSKWYILGDLHNTILGLLNTMGQYFAQTTWSHCSQPSLCISWKQRNSHLENVCSCHIKPSHSLVWSLITILWKYLLRFYFETIFPRNRRSKLKIRFAWELLNLNLLRKIIPVDSAFGWASLPSFINGLLISEQGQFTRTFSTQFI